MEIQETIWAPVVIRLWHPMPCTYYVPTRGCSAAMLAALRGGTTLVVDRYAFSGVAFTAAKGKAGLGLDWCRVRARLRVEGEDETPSFCAPDTCVIIF